MRHAITALTLAALLAAPAFAKLPALSDEAKAKAVVAAAKTAWNDKIGLYQLCKAMDRTAEAYRNGAKVAGKEAPAPVETPPCAEPGPVAEAPAPTPPLEAAGAHSPPTMAVSPPSSKATAAEIQGTAKK